MVEKNMFFGYYNFVKKGKLFIKKVKKFFLALLYRCN